MGSGAGPACLLDLTLATPEQNLALDEALLRVVDAAAGAGVARRFLRFWESPRHFVVLGVSCRLDEDVDVERCRADGVAILRRASGGGTVVQGPGCLSYALVVPLVGRPELTDVPRSYAAILEPVAAALGPGRLAVRGSGDLVLGERKVAGSAQKRTPRALLHQGSILLDFDLAVIERCLKEPARRPEYRGARQHRDFITNLPLAASDARQRLAALWEAEPAASGWELPPLESLIAERYGRREWTERF